MTVSWSVHPANRQQAQALARASHVHPITAQLLLNRGVRDALTARRFLSPDAGTLNDPFMLPDMERAVARLRRAVTTREPILLFGDADVDGLTATVILYEALRSLGALVRVKLSNRIEDGYGLSTSTVTQICRSSTRLLILVDCGTNQAAEIARLAECRIDTIVIDHHLPLETLAKPLALLNPHRTTGRGRELCSAGLALKVAQALWHDDPTDRLSAHFDLAALGTLADYVPLLGENRLIVTRGLPRIINSLRPGLSRLCEATQTCEPTPEQVTRRLVPRLNAFGRLGDPTTAWHLLRETDDDRLEEWLAEAEQAHATTKQLHRRIIGEAEEQINRLHFRDQFVLVVSRSGWHQGLMGPLASQLTARYGRPAIAIAVEKHRGTGSGRSIPLCNLLELLKSCQGLLEQFGGHAQACGLTVHLKNLEPFRSLVNRQAQRSLGREGLVRTRTLDLELSCLAIQPRWVEEAQRLAPFGPGNPRPSVLIRRVIMEQKSSRTGWLTDGTRRVAARGTFPPVDSEARYDVAVSPTVSDGELILSVHEAKAASAPSGPAQT